MMESIFSGSRAVDKEKGTNPQKRGVRDVRRSNLRLVVAAFRAHPTTSRVAIAKETGLSPSTVGSLVTELLERKIILECGSQTSTAGRSRTDLCLNPGYGAIYVFEVCGADVWASEFDMTLRMTDSAHLSGSCRTGNDLMECISDAVDSRLGNRKLLGIGVLMRQDMEERNFRVVYDTGYDSASISLREALITQFRVAAVVSFSQPYTVRDALQEKAGMDLMPCDNCILIGIGQEIQASVTLGAQTVPLRSEFCNRGQEREPGSAPASGFIASLIELLCAMFATTQVFLTSFSDSVDAAYLKEVQEKVRRWGGGSPPEIQLLRGFPEKSTRRLASQLLEGMPL